MSKAFTRESDDAADLPPISRAAPPAGVKNYITPGGLKRLRAELERLLEFERPGLASQSAGDQRWTQLRALDQRIRQLQESLQTAVVVPPPVPPDNQVRFGATVTVRDGRGDESCYRIVGVDETDLDRDWVSWLSPIAKALFKERLGGRVRCRFPAGEEELEILRIGYEEGV